MANREQYLAGRAAQSNPANQFDSVVFKEDLTEIPDSEWEIPKSAKTEFIPDDSQSVVSENDSPDLNFRYSLNPYRGCSHGCSYCYARTYHEYLGFSAGLDFETKILYKPKAASLFRDWLNKRRECEPVNLCGGTDCYQPVEKEFKLTRQCLVVATECNQPITIVTKNTLILRDLDLLQQLADSRLIQVNISITSLDQELIRVMEPRTSCPQARLRTIEVLNSHNIPTRALLSPIIPGLNDSEIPKLVEAVSHAGAQAAGCTVVRLPGAVQEVFLSWLNRALPSQAAKVESRIRQIRDGGLHDARFGKRMSGTGELANQIQQTFRVFSKKHGLGRDLTSLDVTKFIRPGDLRQRRLF